ncbi:MAG: hypothetical protein ACFHU9_09865 [Fluviicola sp.]
MKTWVILFLFCLPFLSNGQQLNTAYSAPQKRLIDASLNVVKTGPYLGLQQGRYLVLELGAERQWRKIRLLKAQTHALHMGFNYNFRYNVLGYDVGYWYRPSRLGLTYGGNLFFRTDFENPKVGFAPAIGYKFWWLHLQTGYHFMPRPKEFETNTFFISLRFGIINDRDFQIKR